MPTETTLAAALAGLLLAPALFIAAALTAITNPPIPWPAATSPTTPDTQRCAPTGTPRTAVPGFQPDQLANAATIIAVGKNMNVPPHGWVIAIAAATQESGLRNLNHGDRDSLGLFQQRPSQGWGTPAQILNPTYSATQFYRHLLPLPGWQQMTVNDAAQAVQRSATPHAYARHEKTARALVNAIGNATCTPQPNTSDPTHGPSQAAAVAVAFARSQIGQPYRWGGDGPSEGGWDCSGLTRAAYTAAGITLPRTAQTQYNAGPRLPPATTPQPGDLTFYGTNPTNITHVGIAISPTQMVNAPHPGAAVRTDPIQRPNLIGITRPSPPPTSS